jgi:hypothetical protein
MRILFVTLSPIKSNVSATLRNINLIQGLINIGHTVDILTMEPNVSLPYSDNDLFDSKQINLYSLGSNSLHERVTKKSKSYDTGIKKLAIKGLKKIYHSLNIFDNTIHIAKSKRIPVQGDYDLLISSSHPISSHILAERCLKEGINSKLWIQYWGDPMTLNLVNNSIWPKSYIKEHEKKILKPADKIIYVSPITYTKQKELFPSLSHKMSFVPIPYLEKRIYSNIGNDEFKLGYFGDYHSNYRNIKPLYDAIRKLEGKVNLQISGESNITLNTTNNIKISKRLPYQEVINSEEKCDMLVCVCNNFGTQIPGKAFHYAGTNKPILLIVDGDGADVKEYFSRYKKYIICNNDENDIREAILQYMKEKNKTKHLDPIEDFSANNIAKQFISKIL